MKVLKAVLKQVAIWLVIPAGIGLFGFFYLGPNLSAGLLTDASDYSGRSEVTGPGQGSFGQVEASKPEPTFSTGTVDISFDVEKSNRQNRGLSEVRILED
jgi:hypothetical protein